MSSIHFITSVKKVMSNFEEVLQLGASNYVDDIEVDSVIDDENTIGSIIDIAEEVVVDDDLAYIAQFAAIEDFSTNIVQVDVMNFGVVESCSSTDSGSESDAEGEEDALPEKQGRQDSLNGGISNASESDSESDSEFEKALREKSKMIQAKAIDCDEEADTSPAGPPRTKHEVVDDTISPIDLPKAIEVARDHLQLIGEVMYRIEEENAIVVQAKFTSEPLNEGSLLCNQDGIVLGSIHEVFGPINTPFYIVRYRFNQNDKSQSKRDNRKNSKSKNNNNNNNKLPPKSEESKPTEAEESKPTEVEESKPSEAEESKTLKETSVIETKELEDSKTKSDEKEHELLPSAAEKVAMDIAKLFKNKTQIYTVPDHAHYLTSSVLQTLKVKGSDASNIYDEEPGDDEIEYSDDEQELLAKQAKNKARKDGKGKPTNNSNNTVPNAENGFRTTSAKPFPAAKKPRNGVEKTVTVAPTQVSYGSFAAPSPTTNTVYNAPTTYTMYPNTAMYYGQTAMYPTSTAPATTGYTPPMPMPWMGNHAVTGAYPSQLYPTTASAMHPSTSYNPYAMNSYGMPSYGNYSFPMTQSHVPPFTTSPPPPPRPLPPQYAPQQPQQPQQPPPPTAPYPSKL